MSSSSIDKNDENSKRLKLAWKSLVDRDYATALRESSALAEMGYPLAWLYLGRLHQNAWGVPRDYPRAETCYRKAIALGNVDAFIPLGRLYKELGASEKAFECFLNAANSGNLPGIYRTGRAYLRGHGTRKDIEKAKKYLKMAIDKGHVYARMEYCGGQIRGEFGNAQRIVGLLGSIGAMVSMAKEMRSDPHGDRLRC